MARLHLLSIAGLPVVLILVFFLNCCLVHASPVRARAQSRGGLPVVHLPYGSFRAAEYNEATDIYTFKNIPFAAPPVGNLRWAKPATPLNYSGIQDGSHGPSCLQGSILGLDLVGPGAGTKIGQAVNQFLGGLPVPLFSSGSEDCLYLDVYVPAKAVSSPGSLRLPVVVYIFGGAFVIGSKDVYQPLLPFYDGSGLIGQAAGKNLVFVSINYRLGALGFLAGETMERDGLPNAGLWDQRAALQWVRDHISLFGGDPAQVTAMGESAGAGSIVHHLVARGGELDPLFRRAILLSPAFEPMWDRAGIAEDTFRKFASLAGCEKKKGSEGGLLECLRAASPSVIKAANERLMDVQTPGSFAVGPTPDGSFIRQLPVLELSLGRVWKIESLLLSHCAHESAVFVPHALATDADFSSFLAAIFPSYLASTGLFDRITAFYPAVAAGGAGDKKKKNIVKYANQADRVAAFLRDSSMTCNIRYLNAAVGDARTWNMQYSVSPGLHGTDLPAVFFNPELTSNSWVSVLASLVLLPVGILFSGISRALQSYLVSYAATGDPNKGRVLWNLPPTVQWNHPGSAGETVSGVVDVGNYLFRTVEDDQMGKAACDFWRDWSAAVTVEGGYAPPGEIVAQGMVTVDTQYSSWRYVGGNEADVLNDP